MIIIIVIFIIIITMAYFNVKREWIAPFSSRPSRLESLPSTTSRERWYIAKSRPSVLKSRRCRMFRQNGNRTLIQIGIIVLECAPVPVWLLCPMAQDRSWFSLFFGLFLWRRVIYFGLVLCEYTNVEKSFFLSSHKVVVLLPHWE